MAEAKQQLKDLNLENAKLRELLKVADRANEDLVTRLAALATSADRRRRLLDGEMEELRGSAEAMAAGLNAWDIELQSAKHNAVQVPSSDANGAPFPFFSARVLAF